MSVIASLNELQRIAGDVGFAQLDEDELGEIIGLLEERDTFEGQLKACGFERCYRCEQYVMHFDHMDDGTTVCLECDEQLESDSHR